MPMNKFLRTSALGLCLAFAFQVPGLFAATPAAAKVLAKVNGVNVTDEDVKIALDDLGPNLPPQLDAKARQSYVLDYLIDARLVAQKAESEKLDKGADFAAKLNYLREKALMESLLNEISKTTVTDAALKATYEEAAKMQKPEPEIHARHILVPTDADAQEALKRIKGGEDFAKVAKEVSKDPGSEGGDLGWFTKDRMVPEFADAAFKLDNGQISEPVKSQFGWHIIQVLEKREKTFPPFDQVKDQVAHYIVQKAQSELVQNLRKNAKIEKMEPEPADASKAPEKK
jgi:peptidyl-prolyl cis-trans isomerase C